MASDLVPERTDVWTDVRVPANGFTIRGVFPRGDGAKFDIGELTEMVRQHLAGHGVPAEHVEGFLLNRGKHLPSPADAATSRDFSAEVHSHISGKGTR